MSPRPSDYEFRPQNNSVIRELLGTDALTRLSYTGI